MIPYKISRNYQKTGHFFAFPNDERDIFSTENVSRSLHSAASIQTSEQADVSLCEATRGLGERLCMVLSDFASKLENVGSFVFETIVRV